MSRIPLRAGHAGQITQAGLGRLTPRRHGCQPRRFGQGLNPLGPLQAGHLGPLLLQIGPCTGGGAAHARQIGIGAGGYRGVAGFVITMAGHCRLCALQIRAGAGQGIGGVLVGIRRFRAGHRLLRNIQLRSGRRQAGAAPHQQHATKQRGIQQSGDLCEA